MHEMPPWRGCVDDGAPNYMIMDPQITCNESISHYEGAWNVKGMDACGGTTVGEAHH